MVRSVFTRVLKRGMALGVSLCLVATQQPHAQARNGSAHGADTSALRVSAEEPRARPAADHFLRDAVPVALASGEPPDTTEDDFVLPEEKSKKSLAREIAVFVVASAFVAYFIVKVFIEKDNEPADTGGGGKNIPPPR